MKKFSGKKLREARERKRLSVRDLSLLLSSKGVTVKERQLYNWEAGVNPPSADAIPALSLVLSRPIAFFYAETIPNCFS